ncbi:hypothetical protein V6259_17410 [Marinomonas sp. TI.3.20]|uniref:hypothetical protein n=1 Tax=Marinomonas sp. TI.3.20 TaxID=3121296 RepID=UPI00311F6435
MSIPQRLKAIVLTVIVVVAINACSKPLIADAMGNLTIRSSVTYLYLLRHTPFFTSLKKEELRWVIKHSKEWSVEQGGVVATNSSAPDYWILLDGAWQLECGDKRYPSKNDDAGKWFSSEVISEICKLVVTESSYVMQIPQTDMNDMIQKGFNFQEHLEAGLSYYEKMFLTANKR